MVARHGAARHVGNTAGQRPLVELVAFDVIRQRLVLILGKEGGVAAVDPQVPRVLDRRQLVGVVPHWPGDPGAGVHHLAPLEVERVGLRGARAVTLPATPQLAVLQPQILGRGPFVDQLRPLALPGRVPRAVEQAIGQIVGPDHGDRAEAGDLGGRACQAQDGTA